MSEPRPRMAKRPERVRILPDNTGDVPIRPGNGRHALGSSESRPNALGDLSRPATLTTRDVRRS